MFWQSSIDGSAIMRAALFADIANKSLRKEENKFLLGNDLLIVPPWDKTKRFPRGNWRLIELLANDYKDPFQVKVYLRAGAILSLGEVAQSVEQQDPKKLELIINLDASGQASGLVYLDAGEGWSYKKADYRLIEFKYKNGELINPDPQIQILKTLIVS